MFDIWELLKTVDLTSKLQPVLASLEATDPRFVAVLVLVLIYLGSKMVSGQPTLRMLGLRLAAVAFLLFGGYAFYETREDAARDYLTIALRSFNAAGLVLALTWILLPVVSFFYDHLRLALAAFLGYCGYALVTEGGFNSEQFPVIAARALIAVALTLVVAWILHPIWDFIKELLPQPAPKPAPAPAAAAPAAVPASPRSLPPAEAPGGPAVSWEPPVLVPSSSPAALEEQRRRDKVRLKIELAYVMAMPAISSRLPRPVFDDLVRRYLNDQLPPADVEENGRQLELILHEHNRQAQATAEPRNVVIVQEQQPPPLGSDARSLEDLIRHFLDEKRTPGVTLDGHAPHNGVGHLHANLKEATLDMHAHYAAPVKEIRGN